MISRTSSFFTKNHFSQPVKFFYDPTARHAWVGANGDWLALILGNGGIQLHNVYTGLTVDVSPFTSLRFHYAGDGRQRRFYYDLISLWLVKIAIVHPPGVSRGRNYDLIAVFDKRIAITERSKDDNTRLTWYMLAVYSRGRYYAVTNRGTCYMWDPADGGN